MVPPLLSTLEELCENYFRISPLIVGPGVKTDMPINYDNPYEVGADRIVNAVAAYTRYKRSLIIVDFGTATTFDCISEKGEYMGGVIVPGPILAAESLAKRTAKLPNVEIVKPQSCIGKSTNHSIQSGLYYGYVGLIKEVLKESY